VYEKKIMLEYESLGHMERIINEEIEVLGKTCYLPHHVVFNENSTTTKVRVIFYASGNSLNDTLMKGPVIQNELLYILSYFRTYRYVLSTTKM